VARAQFQMPRLEKIGETRMKDGQYDWRAQAWLVKFANPEVHGAPSRRRKLQDVEVEAEGPRTPEEWQAYAMTHGREIFMAGVEGWRKFEAEGRGGVITPEMLFALQERRRISLKRMAGEEDPEEAQGSAGATPGHGETAKNAESAKEERGEGDGRGELAEMAEMRAATHSGKTAVEAARPDGRQGRGYNSEVAAGHNAAVESDGSEAEAPKNVTIRPETPVAPSAGPAAGRDIPAKNGSTPEVLARPAAAEASGGGGARQRLRRRDLLAQRRLERRMARAQPRRAAA
jgi:hypothetical protein